MVNKAYSKESSAGQKNYSIMNLKEFDPERHILIEDAKKLIIEQNDPTLPLEKLARAIDSNQVNVYKFKGQRYQGQEYIDRLDIGRIYHQEPAQKKGLSIERYFTDGKTNPFDTVGPYKERRVEIKDKDGKAVFEMNDAVFPESWNDIQASIATQKYFLKPDDAELKEKIKSKLGKPYEYDIKHLITRVTNFIADEGEKLGYFATKEDKEAFVDELKWLQINRKLAFNSPVQFNAGIFNEYDITGSRATNYWRNPETGEVTKIEEGCYFKPQSHACFINGPRDDLESIANHIKDEISIFSSGSGVGQNIGALRESRAKLSGGGASSGAMSFGKIFDGTGGTVKSGGKSRRAARMMTMRYSHPDSPAFISDKVREDYKCKVLIENGFSAGMDGDAATTVAYQNTNLSIMLDDYFFDQVSKGGKIQLRGVKDGKVVKELSADQMLKEIAFGSWRIGDPGVQYDSKIQEMNTVKNSGRINSSNPCSEYLSINDTSCNLLSQNILEFCDEKGNLDVKAFKKATMTASIALDIINDASSYPVEEIAHISPELRNIGLGYAGVGSFLMRKGIAYNSDTGRSTIAALTAILTGAGYEQSSNMAKNLGTFIQYEFNKKPMHEVMQKHRKALDEIQWDSIPSDLKEEAYNTWDTAIAAGEKYGYRNSQVSAIAPTGTISFLLGSEDSTGIEPLISLGIRKDLAGGGELKIKNKEFPNALKNLGYDQFTIDKILNHVAERGMVIGAPGLKEEHYKVFDTSLGAKGHGTIAFDGHVKMLAAATPFVSGAISKTCNMPESCTVKDMYDNIILAHKLGVKAIAMFRDNSKPTNVYFNEERNYKKLGRGEKEDLPTERDAHEIEFGMLNKDGTHSNYHVIVSEYSDGRPGQVAFLAFNTGTELGSLLTIAGVSASKALKRGVDLEDAVSAWIGHKFEPNGLIQGHKYVKSAASILDFAGKALLLDYKGMIELANDPESVDITKLRGFKNGAFRTYAKKKVNEWDLKSVLNDPILGGFVENRDDKTKYALNGNGNGFKMSGGATCKNGHMMLQTSPNCYSCPQCGDKIGGCGA